MMGTNKFPGNQTENLLLPVFKTMASLPLEHNLQSWPLGKTNKSKELSMEVIMYLREYIFDNKIEKYSPI